nr:glycosyltransferase family 2 protein [Pseudomonadota bacterium]
VLEGFRLAVAAGFTHALQIDADGQHDLDAVPTLIALAEACPEAVVSGQPVYDASVPKARAIGRWVTHIWVWIETLSLRIKDSMCGFRIYPLGPVTRLMAEERIGRHMDFDTDIMVRLFWRGTPPVMVPVKVTYPANNTSNFDMVRDNIRISLMHARLCVTMLSRLPSILANRPPALDLGGRWAFLSERGAFWGLRLCAWAYGALRPRGCRLILMPAVFYFYLTATVRRRASQAFLSRALQKPATFRDGYMHFLNFACRALDVFGAWSGRLGADVLTTDSADVFETMNSDPQGCLIVVAHLGNTNLAHALLDKKLRDRVTVLAHTHHAANYNRLLHEVCPDAGMNILQVTDIGPETIIDLKQRIEGGARVVIAGDRTPVRNKEHIMYAPFFGAPAPFPVGPWVLGVLLDCPVYLLFCLKDGRHYRVTLELFAERVNVSRAAREQGLRNCVERYAARLEHYARIDPFQWYNFFDFWTPL